MKTQNHYKLLFHKENFSALTLLIAIFLMFNANQFHAQNATLPDSLLSEPVSANRDRKFLGGTFTNFGFGGPAIKFSRFNNQFAFMTGGRGAATINNRYTIGGGGYGIANSIALPGSSADTIRYFKMGYGGLELGYIFFSSEKVYFGSTLLIAAGAAFSPGKPKSSSETLFGNEFKFLSVMEPSLYGQLILNRFMRLHAGISYRYVSGSDLTYMNVNDMNGFSCYAGLLFGK
jgi:hypothetical protein